MFQKPEDLKFMADRWSSGIIPREKAHEFTGGLLCRRYLEKLDCLGQGPKRFRIGRKICYRVEDFIAWLEQRLGSE